MESKKCIAPPPAAGIETTESIPRLSAPDVEPVEAIAPAAPAPRAARSEVRAAAALFVFLFGVITVAGGAVAVVVFR